MGTIEDLRARVVAKQRQIRGEETETMTATETKPRQLNFALLLSEGVDEDFDTRNRDALKAVVTRCKALAYTVHGAIAQPETKDKLHAIRRGAEQAQRVADMLRALSTEA